MMKAVAMLIFVFLSTGTWAEEWKFGIGTGIFFLNIDGDGGFNTGKGSVDFDASMDSDEMRDYIDSAFGLGGYAKKGPWTILYSFGQMELEDDVSGMVGPTSVNVDIKFTGGAAELAAVYDFASSGDHTFGVLFGLVHTWQEYDVEVSSINFKGDVDESWTDFIVGLTHSYMINPKMIWSSRVDAGTEGRLFVNAGVTWLCSDRWATRLYASSLKVDFEEGHRGDKDWYLYDATENGAGLSLTYMF